MLAVIQIVQQLNEAHTAKVRLLLESDSAYAELTLPIFDSYRKGENEKTAQEKSNLKFNSFKIIERLIYRSILSFYQVEDLSVKDIMQTSLFYALYGSTQKTKVEKKEELEEIFHQLKRFHIEQQAAKLVKELQSLHINTPLESVYAYMSNYYSAIDRANQEIIQQFIQFNTILGEYIEEPKNNLLKELIGKYKLIRKITTNHSNQTALSFCYTAKLSLTLLAGQSQILLDGGWTTSTLMAETKNCTNNLPFGMLRFYLKNILTHLEYKWLVSNDKINEANEVFSISSTKSLIEAYNFNFPNNIHEKTLAKEATEVEFMPKHSNINASLNIIHKNISYQFNKGYFGRERLSLFLN